MGISDDERQHRATVAATKRLLPWRAATAVVLLVAGWVFDAPQRFETGDALSSGALGSPSHRGSA